MESNLEDAYINFASKISFLEFIQKEYRNANTSIAKLKKEISLLMLKKQWNIDDLSDYIKDNPKSFLIFQEVFQISRFTNTQLIHFVFDVTKLNSLNLDAIYEYMILNLKHDNKFRKIYLDKVQRNLKYEDFIKIITQYDKHYLIAIFKMTIAEYIKMISEKNSKNFYTLEERIIKNEFEDFSIRFSHYLLENLKLNETLETINIEKFLHNKRIAKDTKGLHGNYPKIRIIKILEKNGYQNIDKLLKENKINLIKNNIKQQISTFPENNKLFCTEKFVENVVKPKSKKLKKFDLIIFQNYKPKYLFEINFYSTGGTKIGINEDEYVELNEYVKEMKEDFKFCWITDGNYWLTLNGKNRFLSLLKNFTQILNINTFEENIDNFNN